MKKLDLNKTLRTILLVLAIVLMLIKLINKASAEGMDQYYLDTLRPLFPDFTDEQWEVVETCAESCPYFIKLDSSNSAYRVLILYPFSSQYVYDHSTGSGNSDPCYCVGGSSSAIGVGGFSLSPYSLGNVSGNASYAHYAFVDYLVSHEAHGMKYTPSSQYYDSSSTWNMRWFSCSTSSVVGSSVSVSFNYDRNSYLTNDYCVFETSYTAFTKFEKNIEKPLYTDTGFFNIWTSISQSDNKMLNITWDTSVFPSTGSMNYIKSVMDLTIEINGTAQVVSFDSDVNPELFPTSSGTYIPYKFLQKVADLAEVSPSDSFYLTMVSLTQYAYPSGGSSSSASAYNETSLCSVDLGEIQVEVPAVTPVPTISITETNIVETEYYTNIVGGKISPSSSFPIPSWANVYRVLIADGEVLDSNNQFNGVFYNDCITDEDLKSYYAFVSSSDSNMNEDNILSFESLTMNKYLWSGLSYMSFFHKYVFESAKEFSDIFIVDLSLVSATVTNRMILYTDSYFSKMQLQSLGSIQNMIEANTYYTKALYDYATVRFDGMAQSLEKLRISNNALLGSINANIINLQGLVSSGTDRIVNALQGISGGGLSVSDLSGTLNTLFMPSFEWDTVNYQDYLDSLGVLALPFEFVFDTQSIIKNNYSASIVLPVNDFSVPLGKDFNDNNIEFTVFEDQEDFVYNPTNIFPAAIWSVFQYLCAFGLVVGEAWFTYVHIFRKEEKAGDF